MTNTICWIHGDALSHTNPALQVHPNAPAIFVWDDELLDFYNISLKRVAFMYECLLELPVTIRRGNVAAEVLRFAAENDATMVATAPSVAPRFHQIARQINSSIDTLRLYEPPPFIDPREPLDLKRFSRYWRKAKNYAFDYTPSA